jgi:hypothetical protein
MTLCERDEDRTRLLERTNVIRTVETFRFVLPYLDATTKNPELVERATRCREGKTWERKRG